MGLNNTEIKAVLCIDLDGTLIDPDENAHPQDIHHLNAMPSGILPILTTGRSLPSARGVLRQNGILPQGPFPLPAVVLNGAEALLPGEETILVHYLDASLLGDLLNLSKIFTSTAFFFYRPRDVYLVNPTPIGRHLSRIHYLNATECTAEEVPEQINKLMVIEDDPKKITPIREMTVDWPSEIATSLPYILEFSSPGVTKGKALEILLDKIGLSKTPIYVVGDGENDLTMRDKAEFFFAPDTAQPNVKQQADALIERSQVGLLAPIINHILHH
ncbi:MAG: HAD family phosphatase [Anaerolineaceae bacterium]|nr:HAD family phosphatase [Anaerolineaceae bacterium]